MSQRFRITYPRVAGLAVIQRMAITDKRGYFERLFCADELSEIGFNQPIAQVNHSYTRLAGSVRGMHYQTAPYGDAKIVSCLRGEVFDVAVDLRRDSSTFLSWHAEILSAKNHCSFFIPEGFAHGFQALTDECELIYLHTSSYARGAEAGIHPKDGRVGIRWPTEVDNLSDRDAAYKKIDDSFEGVR